MPAAPNADSVMKSRAHILIHIHIVMCVLRRHTHIRVNISLGKTACISSVSNFALQRATSADSETITKVIEL